MSISTANTALLSTLPPLTAFLVNDVESVYKLENRRSPPLGNVNRLEAKPARVGHLRVFGNFAPDNHDRPFLISMSHPAAHANHHLGATFHTSGANVRSKY